MCMRIEINILITSKCCKKLEKKGEKKKLTNAMSSVLVLSLSVARFLLITIHNFLPSNYRRLEIGNTCAYIFDKAYLHHHYRNIIFNKFIGGTNSAKVRRVFSLSLSFYLHQSDINQLLKIIRRTRITGRERFETLSI